jgi:sugar/nucleoside kinase (ribokinase family)
MTDQQYDVAGLGNAIVDVIASVDDRFLLTHGIAKGGMTLIDEFRAKELQKAWTDHQQTMSALHEVAGGSAANTMAGLASLGGTGLFLGKVADDRLGKVFGDSMAATGVRFHNGVRKTSASTATSMIAVTPDGQRSMNTFWALAARCFRGCGRERGGAARILYIEGYLWDEESAKQASRKAIAR